MDALAPFHPAVRLWFERRFPGGPTPPQERGWPPIARRRDTLIAAPTGSGKTLSAFLVCIDRLYRAAESGALGDDTRVVYVSPLKALALDIQHNLEAPLAEIAQVARELGREPPEIRVAVRSGDTPSSARAAMLRRPPHILITTPESLYLLVTAERSRQILRGVDTLIVDEIHAMARDKRGSHLALTLERLAALCAAPPVRIGLSATQRPIEVVARLLVGAGPEREEAGRPRCIVVDEGHRRDLDLALELPEGELAAVTSAEQMEEILDRIAAHVEAHRTTLVFVNTRRMAERVAHRLAERAGDERVAAHHGSLSKERRWRVEERLRSGELRALVATASLELGIDIGPIELVCQIGSPRSLATFLQRVGRSGHFLGGVSKGRLYPLTRDELVECAALLRGVRAGRLDALRPPVAPLDILAQQIVAACSAGEWREEDLYALVRRGAPFAELPRAEFDDVVTMLSEGILTGRGRRGAFLHRDRVNGVLRGRRGARLAALSSGGAIPDRADYRVVQDPDETLVGTVDEDWAIESMAGDIFLLGSTSWRIRRVESGVVRVTHAGGAPPTIPFWLGEAPARTEELSAEVSSLREALEPLLERREEAAALAWLKGECGIDRGASLQILRYLDASRMALGALPTQRRVVFERFFDETGGMQLVVHAPFGGRLCRALGLALRKCFCRNFDFELQAAANDDAVVLSLGPQHSFPLSEVPGLLSSKGALESLRQAVLASPMFAARWRWNANRALVVLRMRGGKRNPPPIQRMESDDLLAAVFPSLAACQENVAGPIEIPEHPLVSQTLRDCLHEAMDAEALVRLVRDLEADAVRTHFVDTSEPSPLAHEILNGRPYTFLDDAPLEERRTRAVNLRRGLPVEARELGRLDPEAIERVRDQARPAPRSPDELHDVLHSLVVAPPENAWRPYFEALVQERRALEVRLGDRALWCVVERKREARALYPNARLEPDWPLPAVLCASPCPDEETASVDALRGHLDASGPIGLEALAEQLALPPLRVEAALARLEARGFALRGHFDPRRRDGRVEFCARRLLERIHRATQDRLRREIEPVSAQDFMRFLLRWQHVAPGTQREGRRGTLAAIEQLQGYEAPAGAWEEDLLPARVAGYRPEHLDALCLSGDVVWARFTPRPASVDAAAGRGGASPSKATPIGFLPRENLGWWLAATRGDAGPLEPAPGAAADILGCLREHGALFHRELETKTGRLPLEVEQGVWELVSRGWVTSDGFQAVRSLLGSRQRWARRHAQRRARRGLRRSARYGDAAEGRWALLQSAESRSASGDSDGLAEAVAEQLLARWGVVFRDLVLREAPTLPWREILWAFRRLEARGAIRGGRFATGFAGEQYALPGAVEALRRTRKLERRGEWVSLSAADPLNLVGIVTPGARIPALRGQRVTYCDGAPIDESAAASEPARGRPAL